MSIMFPGASKTMGDFLILIAELAIMIEFRVNLNINREGAHGKG